MALSRHMARWIRQSAYKYFDSLDRVDSSLKIESDNIQGKVPMYFEGLKRDGTPHTVIELRLDGPDTIELSRGYFRLDIEVNHIISVVQDEQDQFAYDKVKGIAAVQHADFSIFSLGSGPDDLKEFLFCMKLRQDLPEPVVCIDYGVVNEKTRLSQGSVTAKYRGYFKESS